MLVHIDQKESGNQPVYKCKNYDILYNLFKGVGEAL
jgi:hypothetical protein